MNPKKSTSSFSKREKMRRNPFNRRKAARPHSASCTSRGHRPRGGHGCFGTTGVPQGQGLASHCPRMPGPSTGTGPGIAGPDGSATYALPARRGPGPGRARTLWRFEHPRQPYESWWSNRPDLPMDWGPFFLAHPCRGVDLDDGAVQRYPSSLMRTICSRWRCSNTRSSTPFFDQRFIRV